MNKAVVGYRMFDLDATEMGWRCCVGRYEVVLEGLSRW